jgi:hypothetical protein
MYSTVANAIPVMATGIELKLVGIATVGNIPIMMPSAPTDHVFVLNISCHTHGFAQNK